MLSYVTPKTPKGKIMYFRMLYSVKRQSPRTILFPEVAATKGELLYLAVQL